MIYEASDQKQLIAYTDANWGNDRLDRKSITGSTIYYGKNPILWSTRKQSVVALSTAEAEYIACAHVTCDLMYLQSVLQDLTQECDIPTIYVDNQSALNMLHSYENSKRSRHIDIKYHYIKDVINKSLMKAQYIQSDKNIADMFTKPLAKFKFEMFRDLLKLK